ncbi:MAG: hypothetical protein ONB17_11390 [candidate division KSB1 bacterium]|nr:hypothetical protein [candidate division KSB1 bacterium]MDZ7294915.1 hypothetical protein [candidate division KSB1 bacterium]MDZ7385523.1 hypothetical protein [candidate division KSB1 bacterium]MDZ7392630.1 hypothetical protein [candidate division KSB1 bacterium]MDZ7412976.1 hypothetical protein [candidate division KSB1 bacterium]
MRIDLVVDSFSNYDQLRAPQRAGGERFHTYNRSAGVTSEVGRKEDSDKVILSGNVPPATHAEEESPLDMAEQEMLGRLFPPGLFGNGVRAYRLAQGGEPAPKLGQHIDART